MNDDKKIPTDKIVGSTDGLGVCPKCGQRTLHELDLAGSDDYGDLEGYQCDCTACGYHYEDGGRC